MWQGKLSEFHLAQVGHRHCYGLHIGDVCDTLVTHWPAGVLLWVVGLRDPAPYTQSSTGSRPPPKLSPM
jgi:hypothetical protein